MSLNSFLKKTCICLLSASIGITAYKFQRDKYDSNLENNTITLNNSMFSADFHFTKSGLKELDKFGVTNAASILYSCVEDAKDTLSNPQDRDESAALFNGYRVLKLYSRLNRSIPPLDPSPCPPINPKNKFLESKVLANYSP